MSQTCELQWLTVWSLFYHTAELLDKLAINVIGFTDYLLHSLSSSITV